MSDSHYKELLKAHLGFIKISADEFDQGNFFEALRIAHSLRVIFHDTGPKGSTALLTHLDAWDISLRTEERKDSLGMAAPEEVLFSVSIRLSPENEYVPFRANNNQEYLKAKEWWKSHTITIIKGSFITRKIVATDWLANKVGGSHADSIENIPENYTALMNLFSITPNKGISIGDGQEVPVKEPFNMVRSIAHEVLTSADLLVLAGM